MIFVVNKYKEPNHIYCGRGSALGNPYVAHSESDRDDVCDKYETYFYEQLKNKNKVFIEQLILIYEQSKISDVNLGCFCNPKRCHCDTIKRFLDLLNFMDKLNQN